MHPKVASAVLLALTEYSHISVHDANLWTSGLIYGLIQKDDLSEMDSCVTDVRITIDDLKLAIECLKKKDFEGLVSAL